MRILVTFAVTLGMAVALAWMPMPGAWWHAARWAAYLPVLAVSGRHGPMAGLWSGIAASLLWAALTANLGVNDAPWLTLLVPDFVLVGLLGGRLLGARQPSRRLPPASGKKAWVDLGKIPEPATDLNPIASIQSAAGLLAEDDTSADVRHELAGIISNECGRLAASITSMALRNAAKPPPQLCEVDLKPIIDAAVGEAEFILCERGIVVEKQIAAALPQIVCNPDQIRSLLTALTIGAVQSASQDLILDVHHEDEGIVLEIKDCGKGSVITRILDRFLGPAPEPSSAGLTDAYAIVRQHGGRIKATVNTKKGLEFLVWLPLRQNDVNGERQGTSGGGR